ncbi:MAG: YkgJ family cysteine cluster protein [Planctomycetes bacterium]|nr:YkgJ family cysteine cluster protein [Planctomycetota bacterium]
MTRNYFFRCQRSGNCCRVGTGRVWLTSAEMIGIARALRMELESFVQSHVVQVGDRYSLMEAADGACLLLNGAAECTVYEVRPQQCRDFPKWEHFDGDEAAWARATGYCPGIQRLPNASQLSRALAALASYYSELSATGKMDSNEQMEADAPCLAAKGRCQASSMEVDYFLTGFHQAKSASETNPSEACPALAAKRCTAIEHRPLVCRSLSAEQSPAASMYLQELAQELGYPWSRGDWRQILQDRSDTWDELTGQLPRIDV